MERETKKETGIPRPTTCWLAFPAVTAGLGQGRARDSMRASHMSVRKPSTESSTAPAVRSWAQEQSQDRDTGPLKWGVDVPGYQYPNCCNKHMAHVEGTELACPLF